jgi:hypothetical protein
VISGVRDSRTNPYLIEQVAWEAWKVGLTTAFQWIDKDKLDANRSRSTLQVAGERP